MSVKSLLDLLKNNESMGVGEEGIVGDIASSINESDVPEISATEAIESAPTQVEQNIKLSPQQELLNQLRKTQKSFEQRRKEAEEKESRANMLGGLAQILGSAGANRMGNMVGARVDTSMPKMDFDFTSDLDKNQQNKVKNIMEQYKILQQGQMSPYQKEALGLRQKELELAKQKAFKTSPTAKSSEGQKTIDREFGKEFIDWNTTGKGGYEANKQIFDEAIDALEKGKVSTGALSGIGSSLPIVRTDTRELETRVRKAINGMLRATLGAQFTEKEGERIFQQTFDPYADPEENVKNMKTELLKLERQKESLDSMSDYFNKNGTLRGYDAPKVQETEKVSKAPYGEEVERNGKKYKFNHSVGKYQLIK